MDQKKYKNFLLDVGYRIKEEALEAKKNRIKSKGTKDEDFYRGSLLTYYFVISILRNEAMTFNIPLENINLDDIDPDKDLL